MSEVKCEEQKKEEGQLVFYDDRWHSFGDFWYWYPEKGKILIKTEYEYHIRDTDIKSVTDGIRFHPYRAEEEFPPELKRRLGIPDKFYLVTVPYYGKIWEFTYLNREGEEIISKKRFKFGNKEIRFLPKENVYIELDITFLKDSGDYQARILENWEVEDE